MAPRYPYGDLKATSGRYLLAPRSADIVGCIEVEKRFLAERYLLAQPALGADRIRAIRH